LGIGTETHSLLLADEHILQMLMGPGSERRLALFEPVKLTSLQRFVQSRAVGSTGTLPARLNTTGQGGQA